VLSLAAPHIHLEERGIAVAPLTILLDALGDRDAQVGDRGAVVSEPKLGGLDQVAAMVVWLSAAISCAPCWMRWVGGSAFGAEPLWTTAAPGRLEAGGAGGVGGPVGHCCIWPEGAVEG